MRADETMSDAPFRYGAFVCLPDRPAGVDVPGLAERLGLRNEFEHPDADTAIAYLRRVSADAGDITDDGLLGAAAVVHVGAPTPGAVDEFSAALGGRVLAGVARPPRYTGREMFNFAYAHRVLQAPGAAMPNAFLVPMSKTAEWWEKSWLERHTYFLPRYDDAGRMLTEGHALCAEAGVPHLLRRTLKAPTEPAPEGAYDFVNYFECADAQVPTFHAVLGALRDADRNPEWTFMREGPLWQGVRVSTWDELWSGAEQPRRPAVLPPA
jgi:hypothetical protein